MQERDQIYLLRDYFVPSIGKTKGDEGFDVNKFINPKQTCFDYRLARDT
jgi:hypothetical protein